MSKMVTAQRMYKIFGTGQQGAALQHGHTGTAGHTGGQEHVEALATALTLRMAWPPRLHGLVPRGLAWPGTTAAQAAGSLAAGQQLSCLVTASWGSDEARGHKGRTLPHRHKGRMLLLLDALPVPPAQPVGPGAGAEARSVWTAEEAEEEEAGGGRELLFLLPAAALGQQQPEAGGPAAGPAASPPPALAASSTSPPLALQLGLVAHHAWRPRPPRLAHLALQRDHVAVPGAAAAAGLAAALGRGRAAGATRHLRPEGRGALRRHAIVLDAGLDQPGEGPLRGAVVGHVAMRFSARACVREWRRAEAGAAGSPGASAASLPAREAGGTPWAGAGAGAGSPTVSDEDTPADSAASLSGKATPGGGTAQHMFTEAELAAALRCAVSDTRGARGASAAEQAVTRAVGARQPRRPKAKAKAKAVGKAVACCVAPPQPQRRLRAPLAASGPAARPSTSMARPVSYEEAPT